jgi:hypothetical protein
MTDADAGLDQAVRSALFSAAGELQADVAEIGAAQVTEADLRRALRRGMQAQIGPLIRVEVPVTPNESWTGRLGAFDLAIPGRLACEVKWCRDPDKLGEAIWDALKLSPLCNLGVVGYLVYAASMTVWDAPGKRPAELLGEGAHDVGELLEKYASFWKRWLPKGPNGPRIKTIGGSLLTSFVAAVPIHAPAGDDWELRCVRVREGGPPLTFETNGLLLAGSSRLGPPASPS